MIFGLLINENHQLCDYNSSSFIDIYEIESGLVSLVKRVNNTVKEEILELLYLEKCETLIVDKDDPELNNKASKLRMKIKALGKIDFQKALEILADSCADSGMSEFQQSVQSYELDTDFDIGYCDDDDIGGS